MQWNSLSNSLCDQTLVESAIYPYCLLAEMDPEYLGHFSQFVIGGKELFLALCQVSQTNELLIGPEG